MNHHDHSQQETTGRWTSARWVLIGFLLVAAFFLWTEHRAHLLGALPYLLLLACPLMHLLHHHGHHPQDASGQPESETSTREKTS